MSENSTRRLLQAAIGDEPWAVDVLWTSVGPDAIEDWAGGGRIRESQRLALALLIKDPGTRRQRIGEVIEGLAYRYLDHWAEEVCNILDDSAKQIV